MFRKTLFSLVGAAAVGLAAKPASAEDVRFYYGPSRGYYHSGYYDRHGSLHDELEHRGYHRELEHRQAHRYPLTWRQHERVHDALDHDAYHDALQHRSWHRGNSYRYYPSYPYYGGGISIGGGRSRITIGW